jgi:hypothetical protein
MPTKEEAKKVFFILNKMKRRFETGIGHPCTPILFIRLVGIHKHDLLGFNHFHSRHRHHLSLKMFSKLIIRDCGLNAHQSIVVSLKATPSFPACARDYEIDHQVPVPDSWAAKDISTADGCLELSLLERIA